MSGTDDVANGNDHSKTNTISNAAPKSPNPFRTENNPNRSVSFNTQNDSQRRAATKFNDILTPKNQSGKLYAIHVSRFSLSISNDLIVDHIMANTKIIWPDSFKVERLGNASSDYLSFKISTYDYETYRMIMDVWAPYYTARDFHDKRISETPKKMVGERRLNRNFKTPPPHGRSKMNRRNDYDHRQRTTRLNNENSRMHRPMEKQRYDDKRERSQTLNQNRDDINTSSVINSSQPVQYILAYPTPQLQPNGHQNNAIPTTLLQSQTQVQSQPQVNQFGFLGQPTAYLGTLQQQQQQQPLQQQQQQFGQQKTQQQQLQQQQHPMYQH